jgi:hypothetical protein
VDPLLAKQVLSQLSYSPLCCSKYIAQYNRSNALKVVGLGRFELPTSPLSGVRSNQLSYRPDATPSTSLVSIQEAADAQAALLPVLLHLAAARPEVSSLERFRGHS